MAIRKKFIGDAQIDGSKISLLNNQSLVAKNASNVTTELLKLDAANKLQLLQLPYLPTQPTDDLQAANKGYTDNAIATQISSSIQDAIVDGVTNKAPSQNAVFDALALKQNSLGTGTTSQYLRGDLSWAEIAVYQSAQEIYIDPTLGVDAVGRGGYNNPYATINYAYSQVASAASNLTKWCSEKILFKLAPGTYNENVVMGFKRARIALMGEGVFINGSLTVNLLIADHPTITAGGLPAPWTGDNARATFELIGSGGGMEGGYTSENLMINGLVKIQSFAWANNSSWQFGGALSHYFFTNKVQLRGGLVSVHDPVTYTGTIATNLSIEIDSSSIEGSYLGAQPITAGANMLSAANHVFNIKAHNSQLKSTIGPRAAILEIDGCRILNMDRTMGGTVTGTQDASGITSQDSTSYSGIVNSPFAGTIYKLGRSSTAGTITFKMDANSYAALMSKTIDAGASTLAYNLIDKASGVSVTAAPVNYTRTSADVEASLVGLDTALAGKAALVHTHTSANITDFTSAAQTAAVSDAIVDGVTNKAPSQNAVFDALALKLDASARGAINGVASLGADGKVPSTQLPQIAITETFVVNSQAAMLALNAQTGDVAVRTDLSKSFILAGSDPTILANWQELLTPPNAVLSVNSKTGAVVLSTDDISEGSLNKYYTASQARADVLSSSVSAGDITHAPTSDAIKTYVDNAVAAVNVKDIHERFVLTSTDISNGYIEVAQNIGEDPEIYIFPDRVTLLPTDDFTYSGKRITWNPATVGVGGDAALVAGDIIHVWYFKA